MPTDHKSFVPVRLHDEDGAAYTPPNPLPVSQGYHSILSVVAGLPWVVRSNYDEIATTFGVNTVDLTYRENGVDIGVVTLNFYPDTGNWNFSSESYLVNSDGEQLLDDDDTGIELS